MISKRLIYIIFISLFVFMTSGCSSLQQPIPASQTPGLNPHVLKLALRAYAQADCRGKIKRPYLTIVDFTLPSNEKRLWIFDMKTDRLLFYTYVAHGTNSGQLYATHFSNRVNSLQSSFGVIVTGKTYYGNNGYSLRLHGLEKGINDNIFRRLIVIHSAQYVSAAYIEKNGMAGNTWGCFAIADELIKPVINTIKGGSLLFAYYPDSSWLKHSPYLRPLKPGASCHAH